ncbi:MAG: tRNA (adenosine(37)-N6)-threonylcarbamoyltransferase complex ATPase subunit type 1 TsaE [Aquificaceae bacterium]
MEIISTSEEETLQVGEKIGSSLEGKEVICLLGELGAGKTTLVKGIAKGMGIHGGYQVRSPTFTVVNEYQTEKGKLIHVDLYRVEDISIEEFLGQGVVVIEWANSTTFCDIVITIDFTAEGRLIRVHRSDTTC